MFSVVIPAYNCEKTIVEVLDSVKNQSRYDLVKEIFVVNDGSTDETKQRIKNYMKSNSYMNIIYIEQENSGVSETRNRGIRLASAEWIALLDADDIWLPNKLEVQKAIIDNNPQICFLGSMYPVKFLLKKYYSGLLKLTPQQLCIRSMPSTPSVVFKREVGIELGLFDKNKKYAEDISFFQKFFLKDSYYIVVEDLIRISIGKEYFAQNGLSSNLKKMHEGRNRSVKDLYELGLISRRYKYFILFFNQFKYYRRTIQKSINFIVNKIERVMK